MPLMMIGTPGRPGTTISKPPPANADDGNPIRTARSAQARMHSPVFPDDNLTEGDRERVKAGPPDSGKPNAQGLIRAQMLRGALAKR